MNTLRFKLISNKIEIINQEVNYFKDNNIFKFKVNNELYEYHLENNILIKKNSESIIKVDFDKKKMTININSINQDFLMDIDDIIVKKENNHIELMYSFINDEKTTNCIIIEYT